MHKLISRWGPPLLVMAIIFSFSSHQRFFVSNDTNVQFAIFKTLHVLEYGLLYLLVYRALEKQSEKDAWKRFYNAFIITVFYAMSDEIHQVFVPTREGRIRDVGIDAIGMLLMATVIWKLLPKAPKQLKNWAKKLDIL